MASEWKTYKFEEITVNFDKKRVPLSGAQRKNRHGTYRYYGAQGVIDYIDDYIFDGTYLLIAEDGENLKSQKQNIAQIATGKFWVNNHAHIVQGNALCDTRFLCYLINSMDLSGYVTGSAQPKLSQANLNSVTVSIPDIALQKKIVDCLYTIDKKINNNTLINDNLEQQLEALYRGIIKDSVAECESVTLDQWCHIFTGKKNANQFDEDGQYMFFTCGEKPLRINSYIYDGPAIIISGNGSYTGRTLFYNGRFDLYQRTYACTLKDAIPSEYIFGLYAILKIELHSKIAGGTHGSSIPYIVMNDLAKFEFPFNHTEFADFSEKAKTLLTAIQHNQRQNETLSQIRDALLPKLMSGEIDVANFDF